MFDRNKNIFNSSDFTVIKDNFKNKFELSSFNFNIQSQLLKSDKITLIDKEKNKLEISKGFIDLNANELIGSDYKLTFNKSTFGNTENDPRIYGRYLNSDKNTTSMKKVLLQHVKILKVNVLLGLYQQMKLHIKRKK